MKMRHRKNFLIDVEGYDPVDAEKQAYREEVQKWESKYYNLLAELERREREAGTNEELKKQNQELFALRNDLQMMQLDFHELCPSECPPLGEAYVSKAKRDQLEALQQLKEIKEIKET
jgi:hypothetical protein